METQEGKTIVPRLLLQSFKIENGTIKELDEEMKEASVIHEEKYGDKWLKYRFIKPEGLEDENIVRFDYCCDKIDLLRKDVINYLLRRIDSIIQNKEEGKTFYRFVLDEPPALSESPKEGLEHNVPSSSAADLESPTHDENQSLTNQIEMTTEMADQEDLNTSNRFFQDESTTKNEESDLLKKEKEEELIEEEEEELEN